MSAQELFVVAGGQDDNLGDSALRLGMLRAVREDGRRIQVLVRGASEDFISGLEIQHGEVVHRDLRAWLDALHATRRPSLLLNAGEANPKAWYRHLGMELIRASRFVSRRGGVVLHTGVGFRNPFASRPSLPIPGLLGCDLVTWRDRPSRDFARAGEVFPDWAFALGEQTRNWVTSEVRDTLSVTLRFDRDVPDAGWIERVRGFADEQNLRIVTLAQVMRDAAPARALALRLGGVYEEPPSAAHADLDSYARAIYRTSRFTVSDRVHSLIIGATEGATPIGSSPGSPEKLKRTLAPSGLEGQAASHADFAPERYRPDAELAVKIDAARARLAELGSRMRAQLQGVQ